ncbi:MAG: 50S ribosomal protein L6 [Patescibacteria group bacterium]
MSRIGKKLITLPSAVSISLDGKEITVKGPKGSLVRTLPAVISAEEVTQEDGSRVLKVTAADPIMDSVIWGTTRAHLANMVIGVNEGWQKSLELNGVGYRMALAGKNIKLNLGFSHDILYPVPEGITVTIEGNVMKITGMNRETVGYVAAEIRSLKKPEPYKGKGFKYTDEVIRRKVGKAAKSE